MTPHDTMVKMMSFFLIPVIFTVLRFVYNIVHDLIHGCYITDIAEELVKEEESKTKNIDEDMEKYFNYKE